MLDSVASSTVRAPIRGPRRGTARRRARGRYVCRIRSFANPPSGRTAHVAAVLHRRRCRASSRSTGSRAATSGWAGRSWLGGVGVEVGLGPVGQGIELQRAVGLLDHRQAQAVAAMEALAAGDPGVEAGRAPRPAGCTLRMWQQASVSVFQRSAFGSLMARSSKRGRRSRTSVRPRSRGELAAIVQRLAEQHAGVEEEHRDVAA